MKSNFYASEHRVIDAEEIAKGIENNQFELYYQPKVNIQHGKVFEVEALIRWNHPTKGMIPPNDFIPLAEEMDMIIPLGNWVIETACRQIQQFESKHTISLTVAVNISPLQLYDSMFAKNVQTIIEKTNVCANRMKFEITENVILNRDEALPMISCIKALGVRFSLDDFGTGYSSLTLIKEFPVDEIKIDRSFIKTCLFSHKNKTIVRVMITMAEQLGIDVTAEGVEKEDQLLFLGKEHCPQIQGYYFSPPVPLPKLLSCIQSIENKLIQIKSDNELKERCQENYSPDAERLELETTLREQQGMIMKFRKEGDHFIHTLAEGELMNKTGYISQDVVGKTLFDILPAEEANEREEHYRKAWAGEEVSYETCLNGYYYLAKLRPIKDQGEVVEVILSAVDITERIEIEERFQKIAEYTLSGVVIYKDNQIIYVNKAAKEILQTEKLVGKHVREVLDFNESLFLSKLKEIEHKQNLQTLEIPITLINGNVLNLKVGIVPVKYENESASMLLFTDETKLKDIERTVMKSGKALADVNYALNESSIVAITDQKGTIQFVNDKFCEISKYNAEEVIGENHRILNSGYHPRTFFQDMWRTIASGKAWHGEIRNKAKDGSIYWVDTTIVPFLNEQGKPYQYVSIRNDITTRKLTEEKFRESQEQLKYLAFHDPLTSISNRRMFLQELDKLVKSGLKNQTKFAVAYLDMDGLKMINDAIGHEGGDMAIIKLVEVVSEVIEDRALISRHGGDEFTLLIPNLTSEQEAIQLIEKVLERLRRTYHLVFPIRASIGLAFYPKDALTRNKLLNLADEALYNAKKNGKNQYKLAAEQE